MNRLLGRIRLLLGLCMYGEYGCNSRPHGTWDLDGARFRLCAPHWDDLRDEISDPPDGSYLGTWTLDR